jgi:cobalt-zinc-cadmium efflux system membrane fusion protein
MKTREKKKILHLIACALLSASCGGEAKQDAAQLQPKSPAPSGVVVIPPDSPKLAQIRVEPVRMEAVPSGEVTAPGKVEANPNRISRVALPAPGKVTQVLVRIGDSVTAGQPLLILESPEADAAMAAYLQSAASVTQANAELIQANSALSKANNAQRKAQADYERTVDLFEHDAVAKKEVMFAENELKQAKAEVESAQAAVDLAKATIEQAKVTREQQQRRISLYELKPGAAKPRIEVRSPLAGKVIEIGVVAGEYRNDTASSVLTIADLREVWVSSDVPENAIRLIKIGEPVDIKLDAYPDQPLSGRVARIADTLDPKTRTVKVMIDLRNPNGRLKPEMFGRIRHVEDKRDSPVLPVGAVLQGGGKSIVYVELARGRFEMREVVLGNRVGDLAAIVSGVNPGERVVVDGVMLLKN